MNDIENLKQKANIVDIIGEKIELKKAGKNFKANCPFHSEKTPSFIVNPDLQIYKCFGCGETGDVISFLEKYDGMDFLEAVEFLSKKTGIKIEYKQKKKNTINEKLLEINSQALYAYHYILTSHKEGQKALEYLIQKRNITNKMIKEFKIGYSPKNSKIILQFLRKKGFSDDLIIKSGIGFSSQKGYGIFDRFGGRIMFPIIDYRGNVLGFSGRILPELDTGKLGKYINSPETSIYKKSETLFGIFNAKQNIRKKGFAVLVEGQLDVISSHQVGITNTIATGGTAITSDQMNLLSRFTENLYLALDADNAGIKAAKVAIEFAKKSNLQTKVIELKNYKDPDEFAQSDPTNYKKAIENAILATDFLINTIFKNNSLKTQEGKNKIIREIVDVLKTIDDDIILNSYARDLSEKLDVREEAIMQEVKKNRNPKYKVQTEKSVFAKEKKKRRDIIEENLLIAILLTNFSEEINMEIFNNNFCKKVIVNYYDFIKNNQKFDLNQFVNFLSIELRENLQNMILKNFLSEEELLVLIKNLFQELKEIDIRENLSLISKKIKEIEKQNGDKENLEKLENEFLDLTKALQKL